MGLSPFLRSEILLIKCRVFEFVVLIDPVRGRSSKSVSSRARYPHFLLSDQRSAIIRPRKSRNPEKPILHFARCTRSYVVLGLNRSTDPQLPPRAGFFSSKWPLGMPRGGGASNPGLFGLDGAPGGHFACFWLYFVLPYFGPKPGLAP